MTAKYELLPKVVTAASGFFGLECKDIDGNLFKFADLKDKCKGFLVVNVASAWGITQAHYEQLVVLDNELRDKGLKILAFPCNQFKNQEPGTQAEIKTFAESFGAKFQMMSKIDVNGEGVHPVYHWLRGNSECWNGSEAKLILWNFSIFLVDRNGTVTKYLEKHRFPEELRAELETLIA